MGKRKSSSKPQGPKRRDPLPTVFTCLFCNHEKSVEVKLDKKAGCGTLDCKVCGQKFQCQINYLSSPIDVYSEWVDAADAVADEAKQNASQSRGSGKPSNRRAGESSQRIDEEDEGGYEGEDIVADDEDYD
ncbi:transcription elongation factor Elf1 like-domain-containing protein [Staphylotrichum tortipilum]|uniref:Transcription elongation factor 1 homolog n=1 Tax=Staphylotrichum tortipilum TaxID=2831512 RepID=A0AAN6MMG2_9PEZI|nr:transcription elongation factor Elf1 like-domain-containing protein [Staphylotrichum longicolle]